MNDKEYGQTIAHFRKSARYYAQNKLDIAEIEDVASEAMWRFIEKKHKGIQHPKTYWDKAIKNKITNILRQRAQRKTDQIDNSEKGGLESALASGKQKRLPEKSALDLLAEDHPEKLRVIERCVECISEIYRLKKESQRGRYNVVPFDASINILLRARAEIEKFGTLPALPATVGWEKLRDWTYYHVWGDEVSRELQTQVDKLDKQRSHFLSTRGIQDPPLLSDSILEAIPRLRANPAMLLLRVFYKMFRIGSGKYGARKEVRKIMLELKIQKKGTVHEPLFASITEATNFETLRKKIYWKAKHPFYDRLAGEIYSLCSESPPH